MVGPAKKTILPERMDGTCGDEMWDNILRGASIATESLRIQSRLMVLRRWAESYEDVCARHDSGFEPGLRVVVLETPTVRCPAA